MKVVLDTNVLISGIFFGGGPSRILEAWTEGRFIVYAAPQILSEYFATLEKLGGLEGPALGKIWQEILSRLCHIVPDSAETLPISRDPGDDKFLFCAAKSRADYLVTGDKDLKTLRPQFSFKIVTPAEFLMILR